MSWLKSPHREKFRLIEGSSLKFHERAKITCLGIYPWKELRVTVILIKGKRRTQSQSFSHKCEFFIYPYGQIWRACLLMYCSFLILFELSIIHVDAKHGKVTELVAFRGHWFNFVLQGTNGIEQTKKAAVTLQPIHCMHLSLSLSLSLISFLSWGRRLSWFLLLET